MTFIKTFRARVWKAMSGDVNYEGDEDILFLVRKFTFDASPLYLLRQEFDPKISFK